MEHILTLRAINKEARHCALKVLCYFVDLGFWLSSKGEALYLWKLKVNLGKTKIMIFNFLMKTINFSFLLQAYGTWDYHIAYTYSGV